MNKDFLLFLKGFFMGIANIIPGVSGGTIALITNIYEDLIFSLRSFNYRALKLILNLKFKDFSKHVNLKFISLVFSGSIASVFSVAKLFEFLFERYPSHIWALFFGLIVASIYYVGKRIKKWGLSTFFSLFAGIIIAYLLTVGASGSENTNSLYILLCGAIGTSGMLLPGLSGSFILILMGNYELILVESIVNLNVKILSLFLIGSVLGLLIFSHAIAFLLKKYKNQTIAILTGFMIGSIHIIWPFKDKLAVNRNIDLSLFDITLAYNYKFPFDASIYFISTLVLMVIGFLSVSLIENRSSD